MNKYEKAKQIVDATYEANQRTNEYLPFEPTDREITEDEVYGNDCRGGTCE